MGPSEEAPFIFFLRRFLLGIPEGAGQLGRRLIVA
jgi:hypothetical protein